MTETPWLSIILPVKQDADGMLRSLTNLVHKPTPGVEVLVYDGGSTDGTADILRMYANSLAYAHSGEDGSPWAAFNLGLERARGEWVLYFRAGDQLADGSLRALKQVISNRRGIDMIGMSIRRFKPVRDDGWKEYGQIEAEALSPTLTHSLNQPAWLQARVLHRGLIERVGRLKTRDDQGEHLLAADEEWLLRVAMGSCRFFAEPQAQCLHYAGAQREGRALREARKMDERLMLVRRWLADPILLPEQKTLLERSLRILKRRQWLQRLGVVG
jgi:glycosyltransferase involved in cell wall biosynthesis